MNRLENLDQWRVHCHNTAVNRYADHPKTCKHCGKEIPYEKRANDYCNSSCFASENNRGVCRNKNYYDELRNQRKEKLRQNVRVYKNRIRLPVAIVKCRLCGNENPVVRNGKGFCNHVHARLYATKVLIESGNATHSHKHSVRTYLIYINGGKCEQCKHGEWFGHKLSLEMHHIDGNVDNMQLSNLMLLCPNCHSVTDNYKSKNRNKNTNRKIYGKKSDRGTEAESAGLRALCHRA